MDLKSNKFAFAAAATFGIAYVACSILVALLPAFSTQLLGGLFHLLNASEVGEVGITWAGFLVGFVQAVVYAYLIGLVFAVLYNRAVRK